MIYKGTALVVMLLLIPILTGTAICKLLNIRKNAASCYLTGTFFEWAIIQLISVPLIIYRCNFKIVVISISVILSILSLYGLIILITGRKLCKRSKIEWNSSTVFAFVLMAGAYLYIAFSFYTLQHTDADDARFVVNAVDIVRTNRMFLTNPSTGAAISGFWGDMHRDVVSPWAVYFAYISKLTKVPVTIIAHTILPQIFLICMVCVYWLLADHFFQENRFAVYSAVFLALLVNIYGVGKGEWDAESFAMVRIWQGKATLAAVGIPTLFLSSAWIYENSEGWGGYIFLYFVSFSFCLMSGMGIIIGGIAIGVIGLVYGIIQKRISVSLKIWIGMLIPFIYYGISLLKY